MDTWTFVGADNSVCSEQELRKTFGEDVRISRVGKFNLIHLDNPSPQVIAKRIAEFNPDDLFEDNCPLCQMLRERGGNVVYDES